MAEETNLIWYA